MIMSNENVFSKLDAIEIVRLLDMPTDDRRPLADRIRKEAQGRQIVKALQSSDTELTRLILCDICGKRRLKSAIPTLLDFLDDPSTEIKDYAAEAIGKIGSVTAGPRLLEYFIKDPRLYTAIALGAVGYSPAIPYLRNALTSPSKWIRGGAAWSLGALKAVEAQDALARALAVEQEHYPQQRMREALENIRKVAAT